MAQNPVGWFEIYVQDMKRAKTFYEAVFKAKLERLESPGGMELEMWAFPMNMESPGASGISANLRSRVRGGILKEFCLQ